MKFQKIDYQISIYAPVRPISRIASHQIGDLLENSALPDWQKIHVILGELSSLKFAKKSFIIRCISHMKKKAKKM
jgi:hypothetical protein